MCGAEVSLLNTWIHLLLGGGRSLLRGQVASIDRVLFLWINWGGSDLAFAFRELRLLQGGGVGCEQRCEGLITASGQSSLM